MIGIIDYKMGNLRSVQKALDCVGADARILSTAADIGVDDLDRLILPGVGAFADGMQHLRSAGWVEFIAAFIESGKPFIGICLGLQLLFEGSEEVAEPGSPLVPGLGILSGTVVRFRFPADPPMGRRLKIPHMGWNTIEPQEDDPLWRGLPQDPAVYFVHSYVARPCPPDQATSGTVIATADYGGGFCAAVRRENIWATQFHPEKSQKIGLKILANFTRI